MPNEKLPINIFEIRRQALDILKTKDRKEFVDLIGSKSEKENLLVKVATITRLILLLHEELFAINPELIGEEYEYLSRKEEEESFDGFVSAFDDETWIKLMVDSLTHENPKGDNPLLLQPITLQVLVTTLENAIIYDLKPTIEHLKKDGESGLGEAETLEKGIKKVDNGVSKIDSNSMTLLIKCVQLLLSKKLVNKKDIFGPSLE